MQKKIFIVVLLFLGLIYSAASEFSEAKALVDTGISCDKLSIDQLEKIGDYYMEKMNPGEAHVLMEQMMGGEGSESLRQIHIAMARRLYCNESGYFFGPGMMGLGGGYMGMMGYGGMMDYGGYSWFWIIGFIFWLLIFVLIVLSIVWLYRNLMGRPSASTPLEALKLRYAKGEISKKEFDEMKKEIG